MKKRSEYSNSVIVFEYSNCMRIFEYRVFVDILTIGRYFNAGHLLFRLFGTGLVCWFLPNIAFMSTTKHLSSFLKIGRLRECFPKTSRVLTINTHVTW